MALRSLLEKLFPTEDRERRRSELVDRGLEALRGVRDEHAFAMGDVTRVPSHLQLHVAAERLDELRRMDAARDLEFFYTDELTGDLTASGLRTFGDHSMQVAIVADDRLAPGELYATVISPATQPVRAPSSRPAQDSTRLMGPSADDATMAFEPDEAAEQPAAQQQRSYFMVITGPDDFNVRQRLDSRRWILGRRGSSGRSLPEGYRKFDLDVRETVSREQVRIELMDDRMTLARTGKAPVSLSKRDALDEGEERVLELGTPFFIEDYQVVIGR